MCNRYQTLMTKLPSTIEVVTLDNNASITPELTQAIDACWEKQQLRCKGTLFEGLLFSVTKYDEEYLEGAFVSYRWYIAWLYDPLVRKALPLAPLGVSGLTYAKDQLLLGRRTATVADYPSAYECVPSGGVDTSCLFGNKVELLPLLQRELMEEAHIPPSSIVSMQALALVRDKQTETIEMCVAVEVTEEALQAAYAEPSEYSELLVVPTQTMGSFLKDNTARTVPLTAYIWECWQSHNA